MNDYELILLFDANLGEEKIDRVLSRVDEKIKGLGGEVGKVEKWGTKRLASMVRKAKGLTQGYYVFIRFKSAPTLPAELRAHLKVTEQVVRYFISRAVEVAEAPAAGGEIAGKPVGAVAVTEIKGEPLGESQ